jgi:hypothetical protein
MRRGRIDVHQHIVPPSYARWLALLGIRDAGGRELPAWSVDEAIALMDGHGIATAVVSVSDAAGHAAIDHRNAEVLCPHPATHPKEIA